MKNIVRLYETCYPGKIVGKPVVAKNSKCLGVCVGVMLDLDKKDFFILVSSKNHLLKVCLDRVIRITNNAIEINDVPPVNDISHDDIRSELLELQEELKLIGTLLYITSNNYAPSKKNEQNKQLNIAKLFHLI